MAQLLTAALAGHRCRDRIAIQQMPCLFACANPCSVYLRSEGRMGYVLGKFAPAHEDAVALLDYIAHYLDSDAGVVPYGLWPEGVKATSWSVCRRKAYWDLSGAVSKRGNFANAGR